jgi:hypothetical protein
MNASGENFCPKSRGYAKIGIGSQYGLAKISFEIVGYLHFCNHLDLQYKLHCKSHHIYV